jgi:hypothetical protein
MRRIKIVIEIPDELCEDETLNETIAALEERTMSLADFYALKEYGVKVTMTVYNQLEV